MNSNFYLLAKLKRWQLQTNYDSLTSENNNMKIIYAKTLLGDNRMKPRENVEKFHVTGGGGEGEASSCLHVYLYLSFLN